MAGESDFIARLRALAGHPAARGLRDDAAVLQLGAVALVVTKDMLVEGVHYRADDPPAEVAWKLVAVNLSDLAAKGARPLGVLLGFTLGEEGWDRAFADGLGAALDAFGVPLLGGDTVAGPAAMPRVLSLTALGEGGPRVPSRGGARAGDEMWVSGTIGDAAAGLAALDGRRGAAEGLVRRYRRPEPRLALGQALAPHASAMMDVSDGLLIDAARLAAASGVGIAIALGAVPLSDAFERAVGGDRAARLRAATGGDDYELLLTAPPGAGRELAALGARTGVPLTRIGVCAAGDGLTLGDAAGPVPLPARLGWEHRPG